jgi:NADH:ubiquinone oxidoreductase subunit F (NADH-binding)
LVENAERITTGRPKPTDTQLLTDLSEDIVDSALCDHERLATFPLASGMRYFRSELDAHILSSSCPAGVCRPIAVPAGAAT